MNTTRSVRTNPQSIRRIRERAGEVCLCLDELQAMSVEAREAAMDHEAQVLTLLLEALGDAGVKLPPEVPAIVRRILGSDGPESLGLILRELRHTGHSFEFLKHHPTNAR